MTPRQRVQLVPDRSLPEPRHVGLPLLCAGYGLVYKQTKAWRKTQERRAAQREAGLSKRRRGAQWV